MAEIAIVAFGPDGEPIHAINKGDLVPMFCFLNKHDDRVVAFLTTNYGFMLRKDGEWRIIPKNHPLIEEYCLDIRFRAFQIDWDKDLVLAGELDAADDAAWEHTLVQLFDKDEPIDKLTVLKYAFEVDPEQILSF